MNLQHYALVIAAFLLSGKAGAVQTPKLASTCFPALGFTPPVVGSVWETPNVPLDQWRCNIETERGFLGFSYE